MAKRFVKEEGWNALKKTLKGNNSNVLEIVSRHTEVCIRNLGIPKGV